MTYKNTKFEGETKPKRAEKAVAISGKMPKTTKLKLNNSQNNESRACIWDFLSFRATKIKTTAALTISNTRSDIDTTIT